MIFQKAEWYPFEDGQSLGAMGSENGTIIKDDEHSYGARITLEKDGYQPYGITCGVYGFGVVTSFASTEQKAMDKYETMKSELGGCLRYIDKDVISEDEAHSRLCAFMEKYA